MADGWRRCRNDVQSEEDEDLRPDPGGLGRCVVAERLEGGEDDEHGRPAMVERERQVDKDFIRSALRLMVLLHDVVDVLCRRDSASQLLCARTGTECEERVP